MFPVNRWRRMAIPILRPLLIRPTCKSCEILQIVSWFLCQRRQHRRTHSQ
jgi:hypothetical protein